MSETYQVFLVLTLHRRVQQWDSFSRVEFIFFQDMLREHGLRAIIGNDEMCAIEAIVFDESGEPERIDFWLKNRGEWMFLSLEVRLPGVFVLHETKRASGP